MIRQLFILNLRSLSALPRAERWYWRVHSPQAVRKLGPWLTRYESYQSVPLPDGAEQFGAYNYRLSELWFRQIETLPGPDDLIWYPEHAEDRGITPNTTRPINGGAYDAALDRPPVQVVVPAIPEVDLLGVRVKPDERPIFRWVRVVRFTGHRSIEEAHDWYLTTYLPHLIDAGGAYKCFSSAVIQPTETLEAYSSSIDAVHHRVDELWYEDADAWHSAMVAGNQIPPVAPWTESNPGFDVVSMFLLERPDWILSDHRPFP